MSTAALAETETIQMREREEMEWNRCAVAQREQHTYRVRAHTMHKAKNTCAECRATRSSWSKTNQSIAGWLRSNHHSQQGHNERMADSLWRRSLSCIRLMGEILERFMRHQDEHANKNLDAIQHLLSDTKIFSRSYSETTWNAALNLTSTQNEKIYFFGEFASFQVSFMRISCC